MFNGTLFFSTLYVLVGSFSMLIAVLFVVLDLFTSPGQDYEDLALTKEGIKAIRFTISMIKGFVFEVESGSLVLSLICFSDLIGFVAFLLC